MSRRGARPRRRTVRRSWSSCCCPAAATRSACSTSRSASRGPVTALHVNYGLRPSADEDEAFCRSLCERLGAALDVHRAGPAGGQPPGVGARGALRGGGEARPGRRHRPHGDRPGRDRALPAGRVAGAARAARDPRAPGRHPPAADCTREETAAYCVERGLAWREDPSNERRRVRAQPRPQRAAAGAARRCTRRPRRTCCARSRSCATRPRCSTRCDTEPPRRAAGRAAAGAAAARGAGDRRRAAPWPRGPTRSSRSGRAAGPRRSTSAAACGPSSSTGGCGSTTGRRRRRARCACPCPARLVRRRPRDVRAAADGAVRRRRARRPARGARLAAGDRLRARRRCRTSSPTARSRASDVTQLPVVVSGGEVAWVAGVAPASGSAPRTPTPRRVR